MSFTGNQNYFTGYPNSGGSNRPTIPGIPSNGAYGYPPTSDQVFGQSDHNLGDSLISTRRYNLAALLSQALYTPFNVMLLGASRAEYQGASTFGHGWGRVFLNMLQNQFDARSVPGGTGFISARFIEPTYPDPAVNSGTVLPQVNAGPMGKAVAITNGSTRTYTVYGTSVDILNLSYGGVTGTYTIDSGTATNMTVGGSIQDFTPTHVVLGTTPATHTVKLTGGSSNLNHDGIYVYNGDETSGIRLFDAGYSGAYSGTASALANNGVTGNLLAQFATYAAPQLVIIDDFIINDYIQQVPTAQTYANYKTIITALRTTAPNAQYLIIKPFLSPAYATNNPTPIAWNDYRKTLDSVIASDSTLLSLDTQKFFQNIPAGSTDPYSVFYTDYLHLNEKGQAVQATRMADWAISTSAGLSLF